MEELVFNNYGWMSEKIKLKQVANILELDQISSINAQFAALNKRFHYMKREV